MASETRTADELLEASWTAGVYDELAPRYLGMAGRLVDGAPIESGTSVLDVGCGTGSVAIAAARAGADVAGVDITPTLLEQARENAASAGYPDVRWEEADATSMPFGADRFAVTLSNLGHMYADPPTDATDELVRVTASDGHVGFTAWTPSSLYPTMAQTFLPYLSAMDVPDISNPPFLWGEQRVVADRLEPAVTDLRFETAAVSYPAISPPHFLDETLRLSGLFSELLTRVDETDRSALRHDLVDVIQEAFDPRTNAVDLEYRLTTGRVRA